MLLRLPSFYHSTNPALPDKPEVILFFDKNIKKCFYHGVSHRAAYGGEDSMEQHFQRLRRLRRILRRNKTISSFY